MGDYSIKDYAAARDSADKIKEIAEKILDIFHVMDDAMNNSQVIKTRDLYQQTRQFYQKVANTVKQVSKGEDIPQDKNTEILDLPLEQLQERLARLKEENQRMQAQLDEQARDEIKQAIKENQRLKAQLLEKSKKHR